MSPLEPSQILEAIVQDPTIIDYLIDLRLHHKKTYDHSFRVAQLSISLGNEYQLPDQELVLLGYAALLHDIGKARIPAAILTKPGTLDDSERARMKGHSRLGFLLLQDGKFRDIARIVVAHHEYKQSPYPRTGTDRREDKDRSRERRTNHPYSHLAQIVAAADMYDALGSKREYKNAMPKDAAEKILREQFLGDPQIVDKIFSITGTS